MSKKLYVGNLNYDTDEAQLRSLFTQYGEVTDIHLPMDKMSGRPRGFAFVTIGDDQGATNAINNLDGSDVDGRNIVVNEARPKEEGGRSGGGFGGGQGGGGGRRDSFRKSRY
jgi:RNA recognition motif-containing protein